ncbi:adenosylcobinamide amidohydrolase [Haladaptatus sp. DJG-WS-42]|uniref:adenosylcobinamide amidohydrolase n=1 Tax=Haladaptatus sp. DJG-WS-42 TaxID=3120516 RepID=UPI0030D57B71
MFEPTVRQDVLRVSQPGSRWLSTGWNGGFADADAAFNVSVPEGWARTDLGEYARERRAQAGFDGAGPTLFTGVDMEHLRGAKLNGVVAFATAGVSNPAVLPMEPSGDPSSVEQPDAGTVNVILCTDRALADDAMATLLGVAVEAKTATLLAKTGFTGTTTDAVIVGCDPTGEDATFTGSATRVGTAARACVREAVSASLAARYAGNPDKPMPESVADAKYGVTTSDRATIFDPLQ